MSTEIVSVSLLNILLTGLDDSIATQHFKIIVFKSIKFLNFTVSINKLHYVFLIKNYEKIQSPIDYISIR